MHPNVDEVYDSDLAREHQQLRRAVERTCRESLRLCTRARRLMLKSAVVTREWESSSFATPASVPADEARG